MLKRITTGCLMIAVLAMAGVTLSACDIPADGSLNSFTIKSAGQVANFTITGSVGKRVSIQIPNAGTLCEGVVYHEIAVTLYKPDGTQAALGYGCNPLAIDHYRLTTTGSYRVGIDPSGSRTGTANLVVFTNGDTTEAVTPNILAPVTIATPGQIATLTVPGAVGKRISVQLPDAGTLCEGVAYHEVSVTLYRPDGTQAAIGYGCGALAIDHYRLTTTGTYTVRIDPDSDRTGSANAVVYTNADTTTPVNANTLQPFQIATPGQVANFTLAGTTDQFVSVQVPDGGTVCEAVPYHGVTVTLFKPDGTQAALGYGCSALAIDHYRLPTAGTFTVRIDPGADRTGSGTSALYINADPTTPVASNVSQPFTITTPGQQANLTIAGNAGQSISVQVPNSGTICYPAKYHAVAVVLYKPDGTQAAIGYGCSSTTAVDHFMIATSGTYTVRIDADTDRTGTGDAIITLG